LDQYRYGPRSVLVPGDRFRVTGGPVYVTEDGRAIPVADRGIFVFRRYCVQGAEKWIEAHRGDGGTVILWVGKTGRSRVIPNLRRIPYRVTGKVHDAHAAPRQRLRECSRPRLPVARP
jgi:hypothetical protein